jgi:hypothetical protein
MMNKLLQFFDADFRNLSQPGGKREFFTDLRACGAFFVGTRIAAIDIGEGGTYVSPRVRMMKMVRKTLFPIIAAMIAATMLLIGSCTGDGFEIVGPLDEAGDVPEILTGSVQLENMEDHASVRVELEEIETSILTEDDGTFTLPENLAEGEWTVQASYPYFSTAEQTFVIQNGTPSQSLNPMELTQIVKFNVFTDKTSYALGEAVEITLFIQNVSEDQTVTLSSPTTPQTVVAVRQENETILGGLTPGSDPIPESLELAPGDFDERSFYWPLDDAKIGTGEFEIFALVTDPDNYPNYFSTDDEMLSQFNESLFTKLIPAVITIE